MKETGMLITVNARDGRVEVRMAQRADHRWESEYRYLPTSGSNTDWAKVVTPEGFVSIGMALTAAVLVGRQYADAEASVRKSSQWQSKLP
jgi:hypothetical protein